jgi:NAD+ synthase (glutamine-hydrolysing)
MNYPKNYIRLAAVTPRMRVGDVGYNVDQAIATLADAKLSHCQLVVMPELGLTGYTLGDLVQQPLLLEAALKGVIRLCDATAKFKGLVVVGLPLEVDAKLYNVAAFIGHGRIWGLVPKTYLPNYQEFYEARWFCSGDSLSVRSVPIVGQDVPIGIDLLFKAFDTTFGIEICEDLWAPVPPSSFQALAGAKIIANLSASNELTGKAEYRRDLISQQSARTRTAYVYASAGSDESTTDLVFGGHNLIAANGNIEAEGRLFQSADVATIADIDLAHLALDRKRSNTFSLSEQVSGPDYRYIEVNGDSNQPDHLLIAPDPHPFVPSDDPHLTVRSGAIFSMQVAALSSRLEQIGRYDLVIGLSGGLDSTLALLVGLSALTALEKSFGHMKAITLPGMATSDRTRSNAHQLAEALGFQVEEIPIAAGSLKQLGELGHNRTTQDVTYQNVQARYRTSLLLGRANQNGGLVLGTGDLSEIALGWATFNGDHISHYHINAGVPKTLVRHLVEWAADQPQFLAAKAVLEDIIATPISPELTSNELEEIDQDTASLIGPYELTDFFLYHFIRWSSEPAKILDLAEAAFEGKYARPELREWLVSFITRFFASQWKRSVMPDGPKVGSVSLSPRGDWRMPSAMSAKLWLDELQ